MADLREWENDLRERAVELRQKYRRDTYVHPSVPILEQAELLSRTLAEIEMLHAENASLRQNCMRDGDGTYQGRAEIQRHD
jgi:hypothetical protein